jgi:hypothetical protein
MKFGKTLQGQIYAQNGFPGWSSYFCDYKGLKKVRLSFLLSPGYRQTEASGTQDAFGE